MAFGIIKIACVPTPAGTITTKYRDGNSPAGTPSLTGAPTVLSFVVGVGGTYNFGQHGRDPDNQTVTYSLQGDAVTGISIDSTTGIFTVGTNAMANTINFVIRITDPDGFYSEATCNVTVSAINRAPQITGSPPTLSFVGGTGGTYDFGVHGSDPDGDTVTYSLQGTAYTGISIDANTGVLTVGTSAAVATRNLTIRITDTGGLYTEVACAVTITEANLAPVWTNPPATLNYVTGTGGSYNFAQHASDPNANTLTYSLQGTAYTGITINSSTGLLTVSTAAVTAVRTLTVRIADSGGLFSDTTVVVTIAAAVNDAPIFTGAPATLTFTNGTGGTYNFGAHASDPNSDTMTFSLQGTAYTGISINSSTGVLTVTGAAAVAVRNLTIRVTDTGALYSEIGCSVSIVAAQQAPVWTGAPSTLTYTLGVGGSYNFAQHASDPNGNTIIYSLQGTAYTGISINSSTGVLTVTGSATAATRSLTIRASDGTLYSETSCDVTIASTIPADFIIPSTVSTFNADVAQPRRIGGTAIPNQVPGCIVEISAGSSTTTSSAGTRGPLVINNLKGSASNRATIRSPAAGVVVVRRSNPSAGGFVLTFGSISHVNITGYKAGATRDCGIKIMYATNSIAGTGGLGSYNNGNGPWKDGPSCWMKLNGQCSNVDISYIEIDGGFQYSNTVSDGRGTSFGFEGIGFQSHDNNVPAAAGKWQENHVYRNIYCHNTAGEGFYMGPNYYSGAIPLRNIEVANNYIANTGGGGMQGKTWFEGDNKIHHNEVHDCGSNMPTPSRPGILILSGQGKIYNNKVFRQARSSNQGSLDKGKPFSIQFYNTDVPLSPAKAHNIYGPYTEFLAEAYNNLVVDAGNAYFRSIGEDVHGFSEGSNTTLKHLIKWYNNTIVNCSGFGMNVNAPKAGSFIVNNIVIDNDSGQISASSVTNVGGEVANNTTSGTPLNASYRPTAEIAASGAVGTKIPYTDLDDDTRNGPTYTRGAYEFA